MTEVFDYKIRLATERDESFLFEMLFQSLFVEEGQQPFSREVLRDAKISRYVENWGRAGDLGFVAELADGESIGAVWCRLANGDDRGFAYTDDETPELGIAMLPEHRGKGIGTALLKHFLNVAKEIYPAISLSVSPNNPAMRLYERFGFETIEVRNNYPVMRLKF